MFADWRGVVGGALHNSICFLAVLGINNAIHRKAIERSCDGVGGSRGHVPGMKPGWGRGGCH